MGSQCFERIEPNMLKHYIIFIAIHISLEGLTEIDPKSDILRFN